MYCTEGINIEEAGILPAERIYGFWIILRTDSVYWFSCYRRGKVKGKAVPLQAWSGPEGSRNVRFLDFMTVAQDGGKIVSLTHRPPFTPRKYTWYSFL
jgi:hypothetical protein